MLRERSTARRSRSTASRPSGSLTAEPPANRPGSAVRNLRRRFRTLLACLTIELCSFVCQRVVFGAIRRTGFECPASPVPRARWSSPGRRAPPAASSCSAGPGPARRAGGRGMLRGPRTCAGHMPRSSPPVCGLGRGLAGGQLRADHAAAARPAGRRVAAPAANRRAHRIRPATTSGGRRTLVPSGRRSHGYRTGARRG